MEHKSGWKTSEFWMAAGGISAIVFSFVQSHCAVTQTELIALAGIVMTYILNRGWVKSRKQGS
jgi:hypothetical protein